MTFVDRKKEIQDSMAAGEFALVQKQVETCLQQEELLDMERLWLLDNLGYVFFCLQNPAAALDCCKKALEIKPDHAYAFKGQGVCLAALGDVPAGIKSLLKAISLDPNFFDATHDLAVVLLQSGQKEQAKPWAQRAYQLDPVRGENLVRNFYPDPVTAPPESDEPHRQTPE